MCMDACEKMRYKYLRPLVRFARSCKHKVAAWTLDSFRSAWGARRLPILSRKSRAVRKRWGWFGFNLLPTEAALAMAQLQRHASEAGRSMEDLFIAVAPGEKMPQMTLDGVKQYRDAGVKQVVLRLPTASPERIDAALEAMAEHLIVPAQSL